MRIAIIPARRGSKGLPGKNVRPLCGRPLVAWTVIAAVEARVFDRVVVSTDDPRVVRAVRGLGCEVHRRAAWAATDRATAYDVIEDFASVAGIAADDVIAVLQPTSPLRDAADCARAMRAFARARGAESLISVSDYQVSPVYALAIKRGRLVPRFSEAFPKDRRRHRRQDMERLYHPNGAIYVASLGALRRHGSFVTPKTIPFVMPPWRSVDIDTEGDLLVAQAIMTTRQAPAK